jgi:formylmethanofuran dehydrogenase subunit E
MQDNLDRFEQKENQEQSWLNQLPICSVCGEPIQDETYVDIQGMLICNGCVRDYTVVGVDYGR